MDQKRGQKRKVNQEFRTFGEASHANKKTGHGLNTEIYPALLSANINLIGHRDNPYLSNEATNANEHQSYVTKRYARGLKFHEPGVISARVQQERERLEREEQEKAKQEIIRQEKVRLGELPDTTIGEDKYFRHDVPDIEWWDQPYVKDGKSWVVLEKYSKSYAGTEEDSDDEDEEGDSELEHPSIRYVQHPVPYLPNKEEARQTRVYLTKNEQKKIRRNNRKLIREEHEEKIKLGLEEKPAPKVTLSNMMSVYQNNENITDPTSWERTVKAQVEDRHQQHLQENSKRHEEALKKNQENRTTNNQVPSQLCCRVFRFTSLRNPKIRYKLVTNSRQLGLRGICLHVDDGPGILIVIGTEKSCRFYEKLVLHRIQWNESFNDKTTHEEVDNSDAKVKLTWEGFLRETKFRGWFMRLCASEKRCAQFYSSLMQNRSSISNRKRVTSAIFT